jgi:hypothetical protein
MDTALARALWILFDDLVWVTVHLNRQVRPAIAMQGKQRDRDNDLHRQDECLRNR